MDVTSAAGVYRSTFYLYFKDVYHILECIEENIIDYFKKHIIEAAPICSTENLIRAFSDFYSVKGEYMYILTGANGDPKFINKLTDIVIPKLYELDVISRDDTLSEIKINFLTAGTLSALAVWYQKQDKIRIDDVIRYIMSFTHIS